MNELHLALRDDAQDEAKLLALIEAKPQLLQQEDDSWEGWMPLHNAARWGAPKAAVIAALEAFPDAAKIGSRGGYEPLHLAAMGGHLQVCEALVAVYPEGAFKKDNNGRTPLAEAREGGHTQIVDLILSLPGAREIDEAEQAMRAAQIEELMRPDGDEDGGGNCDDLVNVEGSEIESDDDDDSPDSSSIGPARSLASRLVRAASNALWRRDETEGVNSVNKQAVAHYFLERAKYIPLRLELRERKSLRLIESLLSVSQYTDIVDAPGVAGTAKRSQFIMRELDALLSGLILSCDYEQGQQLVAKETAYADHSTLFQRIFETVRRYKIMNPEKLRDTYGKLIYMLQDANAPWALENFEFSLVLPIRTVHSRLKEAGALALLQDDLIATATQVIAPEPGKSRYTIEREIKAKEHAIETLARRYSNQDLPPEDLKQCIYSIGDNHAYLYQARDPIDRMITLLTTHFGAEAPPADTPAAISLAITSGAAGARLTHSHERQYAFVLQSLTLWREIANDMFRLWCLAEDDLLRSGNAYEQRDTGQGLQRVQEAPRTKRAMAQLLHMTQVKSGGWVGSSLIHLGDSNVPNALMFIDKYSQVEHILNPILATLDALPKLHSSDAHIGAWIDSTFGGPNALTKSILADFFKFGFDGSGADNFFDAGSCIDGRLTSAWHWCSQLPTKPFYVVFKLAGFTSFDGQFQT